MFTLKIGRKTLCWICRWSATMLTTTAMTTSRSIFQRPEEPERAAVRELDEVVEEADRAARERGEEHGQPLQRVVRDRQEREGRREQDHEAAHRGRARLRQVMLGSLLADVLPEFVLAQEGDEARADQDRQDQRYERCDEDSAHGAATPTSASATTSRPTEREPLTSTTSPGSSSARTSSRKESRSASDGVQAAPLTWVV